MTRHRKKPVKAGKRAARNVPPFAHEFRLKVAGLYVEDGYPAKLVASQFGISEYSVYRWEKITAYMVNKGWSTGRKLRPDPSCRHWSIAVGIYLYLYYDAESFRVPAGALRNG